MINYVIGDATTPIKTPAIIAHVCNDIGAWGAGFVMALSRKWYRPKEAYREWFVNGEFFDVPFQLGEVTFVTPEPDIYVANIIGQEGVRDWNNPHPVRYWAIGKALFRVYDLANTLKASVHMPRIGCGLAGGDWNVVEALILDVNRRYPEVMTFVYDLPEGR